MQGLAACGSAGLLTPAELPRIPGLQVQLEGEVALVSAGRVVRILQVGTVAALRCCCSCPLLPGELRAPEQTLAIPPAILPPFSLTHLVSPSLRRSSPPVLASCPPSTASAPSRCTPALLLLPAAAALPTPGTASWCVARTWLASSSAC